MDGFELVEELLPEYDVCDGVATVVHADAVHTWDALMDADLVALGRRRPLVGVLGAARALPELVVKVCRGQGLPRPPAQLRLRDTTGLAAAEGGWLLLGERPGAEIVLGLVGQFWRPVIRYATIDAVGFREFAEPGYAKTLYALAVRPIGPDRTLLAAVMRTATTDERARRWFHRYWTLGVGSGAHVLVGALLDSVREDAERSQRGSLAA
jgi:hypothetical protein